MRVNISIDDVLLKDFDEYCGKLRYTRSELLSKLMRDVVYPLHNAQEVRVDVPTEMKREYGTMPPEIDDENMGWCELHFEKGVTYPRKLITWEDENGTPVISKKFACPKCVEKYESMGRGRVYYL